MTHIPDTRNWLPEFGRPYRKALYANPPSVDPYQVSATEAAMLKAEFPDAQFSVQDQRVYPKPTVGTFAKWPGPGIRFGETAPETYLHLAAKAAFVELLASGAEIRIQPVRRRSGDPIGESFVVKVIEWREEAPIRRKRARSDLIPDVLLQMDGGCVGYWIGIEIRNTHVVDYRKRRKLKLLPMTTLEIDVRGFANQYGDLKTAMLEWFRGGVRARVVTIVGERDSRPPDDPVLLLALRK